MRFSVSVPISPGDVAVNRAWRYAGKRVVKSALYRQGRRLLSAELRDAAEAAGWPRVFLGEVRVRIAAYWPGERGDADAPIKGVLDALEQAGVVEDDRQVCAVSCERRRDAENPRLEIEVSE